MKNIFTISLILCLLAIMGCGSSEDEPTSSISLLSATLNGAKLEAATSEVPIDAEIVFVFSSAVDPDLFEEQLIFNGSGTADLAFANGSTKVTITTSLEYESSYTIGVGTGPIGQDRGSLATLLSYEFTTAADGVIRSAAPCTGATGCLRKVALTGSQATGDFEFYSNYPIYEENAEWEDLKQAVIVIHGAGHNPDEYFNWMTSTFESEDISASTILIAPFFRNTAASSSDDFFWTNTSWRRGQSSSNSNQISSFAVIDSLIAQLANSDRFPFLEKIIITGHSSGAAFTHVYAGANTSEAAFPDLMFEYVVANSQYFYYPDAQRINESSSQLYTPGDCSGYTVWPLGYNVTPPYLSGISEETFDNQFVGRKITYLLGNGTQSDPTLNTTDCENVIQGSSRYKRGENMYLYMNLKYGDSHAHSRVIVPGIGHDGQGMYQSSEWRSLLSSLIAPQ